MVQRTSLKQIAYLQGFKFKLAEDYLYGPLPFHFPKAINTRYIDVSTGGMMVIREGYAWDGATGVPDSDGLLRGSLVHDALYQLIREGYIPKSQRDIADLVLRNICMEDGMPPNNAELVYQGVRLLGNTAADADAKNVFYAPMMLSVPGLFVDKEAP